jgi:Leucine-rich repeat (LRR) protein
LVELPEEDLIHLSSKAFMKMKSLRLFINRNARFSGGPSHLSNELRLLDWPKYPLQSLPSNFHGKKLVAFRMCYSLFKELGKELKVQLLFSSFLFLSYVVNFLQANIFLFFLFFFSLQNFQNLTVMDFSDCQFLTKIPDLSRNPNLEDLNLDNCTSLVEVHDSVGFLDKLAYLNLVGCSNLKSFPRSLKLRSLEELNLQGCSSLQSFPEIECKMDCLTNIRLDYTAIKELPSSIGHLTGLHHLYLKGCKNLMHLPSSIFRLQHLETLLLKDCLEVVELPKMVRDERQSMPSTLSTREYEISSRVELLPLSPQMNSSISNHDCSSIAFPSLRDLNLENCPLLKSDFLMMLNCLSALRQLDLSRTDIVSLPACINRFVRLRRLRLEDCKQLKEILELPPN